MAPHCTSVELAFVRRWQSQGLSAKEMWEMHKADRAGRHIQPCAAMVAFDCSPSSFFVCSSLCPSGYLHAACVPIPYRLCVYCHVCLSVSLLPACSPPICLTVPTMHRKSWFHIEMLQLIRQMLRILGKRVKPVKPGVKPVQKRVKPVKPVILKKNNIILNFSFKILWFYWFYTFL